MSVPLQDTFVRTVLMILGRSMHSTATLSTAVCHACALLQVLSGAQRYHCPAAAAKGNLQSGWLHVCCSTHLRHRHSQPSFCWPAHLQQGVGLAAHGMTLHAGGVRVCGGLRSNLVMFVSQQGGRTSSGGLDQGCSGARQRHRSRQQHNSRGPCLAGIARCCSSAARGGGPKPRSMSCGRHIETEAVPWRPAPPLLSFEERSGAEVLR